MLAGGQFFDPQPHALIRDLCETFRLDAEWEVIGTVGHSEHLHVRGNTYRANLTIAPLCPATCCAQRSINARRCSR